MKDKTRCIISIVFATLPVVWTVVAGIGYWPWLSMRTAEFFLRFLTLPIFSDDEEQLAVVEYYYKEIGGAHDPNMEIDPNRRVRHVGQ